MFTFSITVVEDAESGLTYLYFWGNSNTVSALGGYTLSFNLSYLVDGQWATIEPSAIESASAWDLFDANLAGNTVSAISAEGLALDAGTNSVGLFRVLLPAPVDATGDLLVWVNESGGDLVFDQSGDPISITPSLQLWDGALPAPEFVEIDLPTFDSPDAVSYVDTTADDNFSDTSGTLVGVDSDGDSLTYGISGGTVADGISSKAGTYGTLNVNTATGAYVYTPTDSAIESLKGNASESFVVTVSDGITTVEATFLVNLAGADDVTTFGGTPTGSVTEDGVLTASGILTVFDRDVGDSAITSQSNTTGTYGTFSIGADGQWIYALNNDAAVVQALVAGQIVTDSFVVVTAGGASRTIDVTVNGSNDAPTVANPIPDQAVPQDAAFKYTFPGNTFGDVDSGNVFIYSANLSGEATLPSWLSFDEGTRAFTGTPTNADVGNYDIVVTAYDSSSLTVTDTFRITVNNVDDEATGTLGVTGTAEEGGSLTSSLTNVFDPDGVTTTAYQWQSSAGGTDGWTDLSGATSASYSIASDQSQVGKYLRVLATTTDTLGGITVFASEPALIANVNDAPLMGKPSAPAFFNTTANDTFSVVNGTLVASDPDNDILVYSVSGGSDDGTTVSLTGNYGTLSVTKATGAWIYTPDDASIETVNANATDSFTVTVSDGIAITSEPFIFNLIAIPATTAKYFVLAGSGANYIDYNLNAGPLSLGGQYTTQVGTTGIDAIHIRAGVAVDFTLSGASADKVYFDRNYGEYAVYLSGSIMTLVRGTGETQELVRVTRGANLASSDVLVFADGTVSTWDLYNLLKNGAPMPALGSETSLDPLAPGSYGSTLRATVKAFSLDSTGEVFAPVGHGMHLMTVGSIGVDKVYVGDGSSVDATLLGASSDLIYLRGNWADYSKSLAGSVIIFTRTINGDLETVKVVGGTGALNDKLIFADGAVQSYNAKTALSGNLNVDIHSISGYDANTVTPVINAVRMADSGSYVATPDKADAYLIDGNQVLYTTLEGFAFGDVLEFANLGETLLTFDRGVTDDGAATLMAGNSTLTLTGLMSDNFSNLGEFQAIYGSGAVLFL